MCSIEAYLALDIYDAEKKASIWISHPRTPAANNNNNRKICV